MCSKCARRSLSLPVFGPPEMSALETFRTADWDAAVRRFLRRAERRVGHELSADALRALPKSYRYLVPAARAARDIALIEINQDSARDIVELRPLGGAGAASV